LLLALLYKHQGRKLTLAALIRLSRDTKSTKSPDYICVLLGMVVSGDRRFMAPKQSTEHCCETLCRAIRIILRNEPSTDPNLSGSDEFCAPSGLVCRETPKHGSHNPLMKGNEMQQKRDTRNGVNCDTLRLCRIIATIPSRDKMRSGFVEGREEKQLVMSQTGA
jgi:hypothetical protein